MTLGHKVKKKITALVIAYINLSFIDVAFAVNEFSEHNNPIVDMTLTYLNSKAEQDIGEACHDRAEHKLDTFHSHFKYSKMDFFLLNDNQFWGENYLLLGDLYRTYNCRDQAHAVYSKAYVNAVHSGNEQLITDVLQVMSQVR